MQLSPNEQRLMAAHWVGVHHQQLQCFRQGFTDPAASNMLADLQRYFDIIKGQSKQFVEANGMLAG